MSEPVAWLITVEKQDGSRETYPAMGRFKDVKAACDFGDPVPLYPRPDPRVAELEAVLREAREALVPYMKYVDGTKVLNHPAQVVEKIDEVLKK